MNGAWHQWIGAIGERLRSVIRRHVAEQVDDRPQEWQMVSDITQEALATATQRFDDFRGTTEPELVAWICTIADRKLSDRRRALRRKRRDERRNRALGAALDSLADDAIRPEEELHNEEERQWAHSLISQLPSRHRAALRARYLEEKSISEIAMRLNCSEEAVKGLLKRGLKWLRCLARATQRPTFGRELR
jgi:RNA polymerase sigma-70 factor, ECF subfamily